MSSADGGDAPKLSRNSRSFMQKKLNKKSKKESNKTKGSNYTPQQRSLQCLTSFNCPVCHLRNSVRVDLNVKERQAIVRCTYCVSIRPRPRDLPYPYTTPFVPKLENRADVFFRFNELYRGLARAAAQGSSNRIHDSTNAEADGTDDEETYNGDGVLGISAAMANDDNASDDSAEEEEEEKEENGGDAAGEEEDAKKGEDGNGEVDIQAFFGDSDDD